MYELQILRYKNLSVEDSCSFFQEAVHVLLYMLQHKKKDKNKCFKECSEVNFMFDQAKYKYKIKTKTK